MIKKRFALLSALGLLLFTCKQYHIFYDISLEVEPIEPRIKGSPTNIVQIDSSLYVASRFGSMVYKYTNSEWTVLPQSPEKIIELAATDGALYVLTGTPGSLHLQKLPKNAQTWSSIDTTDRNIQSVYGVGDYLFAGVIDELSAESPTCSILYVKDDESKLVELVSSTSLLKGAVYDGTTYYLATNGSGILSTIDPSSNEPKPATGASDPNKIVGIIKVDNKIVAVSRDGYILYRNADGFVSVKSSVSSFTGSLAAWGDADTPRLLLLGIQGESVSMAHGYREILLNADGTLNMSLRDPGKNEISSVIDYDDERNGYDQYTVTIGKHPLFSIIQAPDKTLFASTAKDGLWSYRERNGKPVWNAED